MTHCALEKIVDHRGDYHLLAEYFHVDERLVGVDNLLHVGCFVHVMGEGGIGIIILIKADYVLCGHGFVQPHHLGAEDAAGEVAAIGYEVYRDSVLRGITLVEYVSHAGRGGGPELVERLRNLVQMLVGEELIGGKVVVAPREMGGSSGLLSGAGRACYGVHGDVVGEQSGRGQGQQTELYAGGEAAGVGQMLRLADGIAVGFGQAIDVVVVAFDAEVLRQVDDFHAVGYGVLLEKGLTLAVSEAEEHHIHLVEGHLRGEAQVAITVKSLVHIGHKVAGIALAVGENYLCLRVVYEQTDELAAGISGSTQYSYSNHFISVQCCPQALGVSISTR